MKTGRKVKALQLLHNDTLNIDTPNAADRLVIKAVRQIVETHCQKFITQNAASTHYR